MSKVSTIKPLDLNYVNDRLKYDPNTRIFIWKRHPDLGKQNNRCADKPAGTICNGYVVIRINGSGYYAHHLAWLIHTGDWPKIEIDHKDRNRSNNRINNLHDVTTRQNLLNRSIYKHNTSGVRGVYWNKRNLKWHAQINVHGKSHHLGYFTNLTEATQARKQAEEKYNVFD